MEYDFPPVGTGIRGFQDRRRFFVAGYPPGRHDYGFEGRPLERDRDDEDSQLVSRAKLKDRLVLSARRPFVRAILCGRIPLHARISRMNMILRAKFLPEPPKLSFWQAIQKLKTQQ
ncbi:MAG: hypothetical protein WCO97_09750 [bacterium]